MLCWMVAMYLHTYNAICRQEVKFFINFIYNEHDYSISSIDIPVVLLFSRVKFRSFVPKQCYSVVLCKGALLFYTYKQSYVISLAVVSRATLLFTDLILEN